MAIANTIESAVIDSLKRLYGLGLQQESILINQTKPEFEGDYTVVLFGLVKQLKKKPEILGSELGSDLVLQHAELFIKFNVLKGFLNLTLTDSSVLVLLQEHGTGDQYGHQPQVGKCAMIEYSSPNTNKPLHLGHLRNNFLGWTVAAIYRAIGFDVIKTCIVNDRGIHICKSMIAWKLFANGATPGSIGMKGDHFVGEWYVRFNDEYKKQVKELVDRGVDKEEAEKDSPIMKSAQQLLIDWEAGDPAVMELWRNMNSWVYEGFDTTYKRIGSDFDKIYYESNTYLLGKDIVQQGLEKGVFFRKEDGSVWIDLTNDGLDQKLVMRKDGTSVYITQDIGLADQKYREYKPAESIYVVGDEQNYHFKVLKLIAEKLGIPGADGIYHLSYGMVELPTGRMKSREGTVVDADDLIDEMVAIAARHTEELGKVKDFAQEELTTLYNTIGLGALKFFLLRVDPKKKMIFNPEESIDFHGFTGPFVQYTYARIKSILRKETDKGGTTINPAEAAPLLPMEKELLIKLEFFSAIVQQAAMEHNPSVIAIYVFELAKLFNSFYSVHSVVHAETAEKKQLRLQLCQFAASVIKAGMKMLGIDVPERM